MTYFKDPVANALAPITDASPEELAEYVRAIASTRPNISVDYVSSVLLDDGLVNVQGEDLKNAISKAIHTITSSNSNNHKVSAATAASSATANIVTEDYHRRNNPSNSSKKHGREEDQRNVGDNNKSSRYNNNNNNQRTSAEGGRRSSAKSDYNRSNGSNAHTQQQRRNPSSVQHSTAKGRSRLTFAQIERMIGPKPANMPQHVHEQYVRDTVQQYERTGELPSNISNQQPTQHRITNPSTAAGSRQPPNSFANKNYAQQTNRTQSAAAAVPLPPPLQLEQRRTLRLSQVPMNITMVQLSHFFEEHNVSIVSMKLVPPDTTTPSTTTSDKHPSQVVYVQCGSHDQANSVLVSKAPVLGYRFIQVTLHPTNLEEGRPEVPPPYPTTNIAAVTASSPNKQHQHQQKHILMNYQEQQEKIASITQTLELKHQQEVLIDKQLVMQNKILQKSSEKSKILKEILDLQKRKISLKQEILEFQTNLKELTPTRRAFRLDRRTKVLKVTGFPKETIINDDLTHHFSTFGHVESVISVDDEPEQQGCVLITFDTRGSAENAKANGSTLQTSAKVDIPLTLTWYKTPAKINTDNSKKESVTEDDSSKKKDVVDDTWGDHDDAMVDYEEDEEEDDWT